MKSSYFFVKAVVYYNHEDSGDKELKVKHNNIHSLGDDLISEDFDEKSREKFFNSLINRLKGVVKRDFENTSSVFKIKKVLRVEIKNISRLG